MKKLLLSLLILICKISYTQSLVTLYNGVTIYKGDTLYVGFPNFSNRYEGDYYSYMLEESSQNPYKATKDLSCTDKLIAVSYEQVKERLLCKNLRSNERFYIESLNYSIQKKRFFTDYAKYGVNKDYYGVMDYYLVISKDPTFDFLHSKYPHPLYTNKNFIYLWYQQSTLPEYAKLKKYAEIKYHSDCSNCINETFITYKKEIDAELLTVDTNQIYSMEISSFQFFNYDSVSSKLKISAREDTYSTFEEKFDDFFNIKCSNYPSNFFLKINKQKYFSLTNMVYQNYISAVVNYKIIPKGSFDSDNDIRIKICTIDFYDEPSTCKGKFISNYFGSVSFE